MGLSVSPDIFQAIMSNLLGDKEYTQAYLDDILITSSGDYDKHLQKVDTVLTRLESIGFCVSLCKCFFAEAQLEYLGYWLT